MAGILVMFASREGQTQKIASRIRQSLAARGVNVALVDAADRAALASLDLNAWDLLVFGASMHAGGLERELTRFVRDNAAAIEGRPRSFFLVSLSAATRDPAQREQSLADAAQKAASQLPVGFDDTEMIAGALRYSKYPRPVKWLMRRIAASAGEDTDGSRDVEYTDWSQVERYAQRLAERAAGLRTRPP